MKYTSKYRLNKQWKKYLIRSDQKKTYTSSISLRISTRRATFRFFFHPCGRQRAEQGCQPEFHPPPNTRSIHVNHPWLLLPPTRIFVGVGFVRSHGIKRESDPKSDPVFDTLKSNCYRYNKIINRAFSSDVLVLICLIKEKLIDRYRKFQKL